MLPHTPLAGFSQLGYLPEDALPQRPLEQQDRATEAQHALRICRARVTPHTTVRSLPAAVPRINPSPLKRYLQHREQTRTRTPQIRFGLSSKMTQHSGGCSRKDSQQSGRRSSFAFLDGSPTEIFTVAKVTG